MIERALDTLLEELNGSLYARYPNGPQKPAELGPVHDLSKDPPDPTSQSPYLRLTLVRIEEERVMKAQTATRKTSDTTVEYIEPELRLGFFVLISAHAKQYREAVQGVSAAITFFQSKPVFTPTNAPSLDPGIEKLVMELISPPFDELNNLFSMLSAGYRPSVLYRVRLLIVQDSVPLGTASAGKNMRISPVMKT
jgi:hypothetical protein